MIEESIDEIKILAAIFSLVLLGCTMAGVLARQARSRIGPPRVVLCDPFLGFISFAHPRH
jgi:hypothetical protein